MRSKLTPTEIDQRSRAGAYHDGSRPLTAKKVTQSNLQKTTVGFRHERADWTAFRTIDGLTRRAGVPANLLRRLVVKEAADNGLDPHAETRVGRTRDGSFFIEDEGLGIPGSPEEIAYLFSMSRPLVSTKLRLTLRGALGNGLRVLAGAVYVSEGTLVVTTNNRRIELRPEFGGGTKVVSSKKVDYPIGTRIEIKFGSELPRDDDTLGWAKVAIHLASVGGPSYTGKTSPWWYDAPSFRELLDASGDQPLRDLMTQFDGDADKILAKAGFNRSTPCSKVKTRELAEKLLSTARSFVEPIDPALFGAVGAEAFNGHDELGYPLLPSYDIMRTTAKIGSLRIPFVCEAWALAATDMELMACCVNRTPVNGDISAYRDKSQIVIHGCNIHNDICGTAKDQQYKIWLNLTTPFVQLTSEGKEPDLVPFLSAIRATVTKAVRKARKPKPKHDDSSLLPKRKRGRQPEGAEQIYIEQVKTFCRLILQIKSRLDFAVGSRDYCYLLEEHGLGKGDFDAAEKQISDYRKSGDLPLDICAEDASRETIGVEEIDKRDVATKVDSLIDHLIEHGHEGYLPISLWDDLGVYVEVATEKLSLRNLFEPVCNELHVPITNFKGWSDLNARAAIMRRFAYWTARGKKCVLLLCNDHDPGGLRITKKMRKNLNDLGHAMQTNFGIDWQAVDTNLVITRFGLNEDFIDANDLTWIDNLETSSGKHLDDEDHHDHNQDYVQDYINEFGVRKCEANALVVEPVIGRQLCRDAILRHVPLAAVERYERRLEELRQQLKAALQTRLDAE